MLLASIGNLHIGASRSGPMEAPITLTIAGALPTIVAATIPSSPMEMRRHGLLQDVPAVAKCGFGRSKLRPRHGVFRFPASTCQGVDVKYKANIRSRNASLVCIP